MEWLTQAITGAIGLLREIGVPLAAALSLGAVIGWEREWRRKPAGLRTHMLVSLGAATFTLVTLEVYQSVLRSGTELSRVDPLRIVEGLIGDIGFLGAGAIIRDRGSVEGLTTAGTIWLTGGVGLACGSGRFGIACAATFLALAALTFFRLLEMRVFQTK